MLQGIAKHLANRHGIVGCRAFQSVATSIANNSVTAIALNQESFDTHGFHDNATNNTRLTVPTGWDGDYLAIARLGFPSSVADKGKNVRVHKNGSIVETSGMTNSVSGYSFRVECISFLPALVATDYIEMCGFQDSGGALNSETDSFATSLTLILMGKR